MDFRGRGSACLILMALACLAASSVVNATLQPVGGVAGIWGLPGTENGIDYGAWAAATTFNFGDTLQFKYSNDSHDVLLVNSTAYATCDIADEPIELWDSGNDYIDLNMNMTDYYFICGLPGHCSRGQKFHIHVNPFSSPQSAPTVTSGPPPPGSDTLSGSNSVVQAGLMASNLGMVLITSLLLFRSNKEV